VSALPAPETYPESYAASLYERHKAAVYRHCLKQLRRREDADDAMQTTFVYALLSLRRGVVPQAELAWLYTIASNVCSSSRRSWARRGALATPQDVDAMHDVIPTPDRNVPVTAEEFRAALRDMPDTQRRALLLREWRGLSYSEIAEKLGLTQAATETLLFRARRTLAWKLHEKTGAGFSLAAFLRSLLQSGAAKTIAVGLGATAIAVTPSAESRTPARVPVAPTARLASHNSSAASPASVARPEASTPATRTTKPVQRVQAVSRPPVLSEDVGPAVETPVTSPAAQPALQPVAVEPKPPTPEVAPPSPPQSVVPVPDATLSPLPPVTDVVSTLPEVQLPPITVPPLPLPLPVKLP
jgi:RNA polymerase sigma factor (sigma-70 family)